MAQKEPVRQKGLSGAVFYFSVLPLLPSVFKRLPGSSQQGRMCLPPALIPVPEAQV